MAPIPDPLAGIPEPDDPYVMPVRQLLAGTTFTPAAIQALIQTDNVYDVAIATACGRQTISAAQAENLLRQLPDAKQAVPAELLIAAAATVMPPREIAQTIAQVDQRWMTAAASIGFVPDSVTRSNMSRGGTRSLYLLQSGYLSGFTITASDVSEQVTRSNVSDEVKAFALLSADGFSLRERLSVLTDQQLLLAVTSQYSNMYATQIAIAEVLRTPGALELLMDMADPAQMHPFIQDFVADLPFPSQGPAYAEYMRRAGIFGTDPSYNYYQSHRIFYHIVRAPWVPLEFRREVRRFAADNPEYTGVKYPTWREEDDEILSRIGDLLVAGNPVRTRPDFDQYSATIGPARLISYDRRWPSDAKRVLHILAQIATYTLNSGPQEVSTLFAAADLLPVISPVMTPDAWKSLANAMRFLPRRPADKALAIMGEENIPAEYRPSLEPYYDITEPWVSLDDIAVQYEMAQKACGDDVTCWRELFELIGNNIAIPHAVAIMS